MLARLGSLFSRWAARLVPDPFVLALLLSLLTFLLAWGLTPAGPGELLLAWGTGFWDLLAFAMEMALILVTGHALAHTRPARALVDRLARAPRNPRQAVGLVALTACLAALVNWGLGLILGALAAREVGRQARARGLSVHYPLLGAAGYTGLLVWHGGLSGSAPLKVATAGHFLQEELEAMGWTDGILPFSQTIFSGRNLLATGGAVALAVVVCMLLHPRRAEEIRPSPVEPAAEPEEPEIDAQEERRPLARRLEESFLVILPVGLAGLGVSLWQLFSRGGQPDLGILNLGFLSLGLLLHGSAGAYGRAVAGAVQSISGILLQFPFYAGIMALMRWPGAGASTSLAAVMAETITRLSGPATLPAFAFGSAALVNLFVPSGGGQWAVQGPLLLEAGRALEVGAQDLVLALSYGDQLTNMLQPFWALPLLGITGLRARDVVGYTAVLMLLVGAWFLLVLLV